MAEFGHLWHKWGKWLAPVKYKIIDDDGKLWGTAMVQNKTCEKCGKFKQRMVPGTAVKIEKTND